MTGATVITMLVVLCLRRRSIRAWWSGLAMMVGLALVCWIGMRDTIYARLATLLDREILTHSLIPHWQATSRAVPDFYQVGGGLGTYRYIYSMYEQQPCRSWFYHAENQYIEAILVGGVIGLVLILIMLALIGTGLWRILRRDPDPKAFAFGVAGVFALSGQAIHAFFDFGLYIPSNVLLFALLCGAIAGRTAQSAIRTCFENNYGSSKGATGCLSARVSEGLSSALADKQPVAPFSKHARRDISRKYLALHRARVVPLSAAMLLLAANIWGCFEMQGVAAAEAALRDTDFEQSSAGTSQSDLAHGVKRLESVIERREDDAESHLRMAKILVHLYRVRSLEQLCTETTGNADDDALWQATSPMVIHARAHEFARNNLAANLEELRSEPVVKDHLRRALKHLVLSRRSCGLLPDVHLIMAQLCVLAEDPNNDQIHIERAQRLAPADPHILFRCGILDYNAGRRELAYDCWRRSLALSPEYIEDVLDIVDEELKSPGVISKLLPDSPELLIQLARKQYRADEQADVRRLLLQRAERLVEQADLPEDEQQYLRGSLFAMKEAYPQAIEKYSRAVELRPHELVWRYELVLLLQQEGRLEEALEHARSCARATPRSKQFRMLLQQIHEARLRQ
jgi:tetratricopeptide (TPR) repeat protein